MEKQQALKFLVWICLLISTPNSGSGTKCENNGPKIEQREVGYGMPPKYKVSVFNSCPMCPIINIHLKCGSFPQPLVNPKLLKVLAFDDCVLNGGLPLPPLHNFSFTYTHHKFLFYPASWSFQCE